MTFCEILPITPKKSSYAVGKVYISILESSLSADQFEGNAAINLAHFKYRLCVYSSKLFNNTQNGNQMELASHLPHFFFRKQSGLWDFMSSLLLGKNKPISITPSPGKT